MSSVSVPDARASQLPEPLQMVSFALKGQAKPSPENHRAFYTSVDEGDVILVHDSARDAPTRCRVYDKEAHERVMLWWDCDSFDESASEKDKSNRFVVYSPTRPFDVEWEFPSNSKKRKKQMARRSLQKEADNLLASSDMVGLEKISPVKRESKKPAFYGQTLAETPEPVKKRKSPTFEKTDLRGQLLPLAEAKKSRSLQSIDYHQSIDFKLKQRVLSLDCCKNWCAATVTKIDEKNDRVKVHYTGWHKKWDEWKDIHGCEIRPVLAETEKIEPVESVEAVEVEAQSDNGTDEVGSEVAMAAMDDEADDNMSLAVRARMLAAANGAGNSATSTSTAIVPVVPVDTMLVAPMDAELSQNGWVNTHCDQPNSVESYIDQYREETVESQAPPRSSTQLVVATPVSTPTEDVQKWYNLCAMLDRCKPALHFTDQTSYLEELVRKDVDQTFKALLTTVQDAEDAMEARINQTKKELHEAIEHPDQKRLTAAMEAHQLALNERSAMNEDHEQRVSLHRDVYESVGFKHLA